jgi:signal peptidase I
MSKLDTPTAASATEMLNSLRGEAYTTTPDDSEPNVTVVHRKSWRPTPKAVGVFTLATALLAGGTYYLDTKNVTLEAVAASIAPTQVQYKVAGNSMEPTYKDGELLQFPKKQAGEAPEVGQIAVAEMPTAWQFASGTRGVVLKRIAAIHGDKISVIGGALHVNDKQITALNPSCKVGTYEYTLKEGELFLLGDNQGNSLDSLSVLCATEDPTPNKFLIKASSLKAYAANPTVKTET